MNVGRMFANALVRRVAFVVVGVCVALVVQCFGQARADAYFVPTLGEAWAACSAELPSVDVQQYCGTVLGQPFEAIKFCEQSGEKVVVLRAHCKKDGIGYDGVPIYVWDPHAWTATTICGEGGDVWNDETKSCDEPPDCSAPQTLTSGLSMSPGGGSESCGGNHCSGVDQCVYSGTWSGEGMVIDSVRYCSTAGLSRTGAHCAGAEHDNVTPPTDSDGDGSSDGNDGSPNNPGSDGSGSGQDESKACGGPGQPVCDEDGSNEGSGKGNTSGGGGDCTAPPVSSGDAILAQIAFQTWATRCAIAGNANEAGEGGAGVTPGTGDGDQPGWTKGNGPANPEDTSAQDIDDASNWGVGLSADLLNTENIFGNSSCPALPSFSIMGYEIDTSAFSWWCTLISIMRAAILIMGAFTAIQILLRGF